jgi:FkbM family methyltransferase
MLSGLRKKLSSRWVQTRSFSQCGEDRIVAFILDTLSTPQPTYLDLGANDPRRLNNTFFFYLRGGRGVLVEPDPRLVRRLKARRRRDTIVQAGVGTRTMAADLFLLQPSSLNTFSRSVADAYQASGKHQLKGVQSTTILGINDLLRRYFAGGGPDFVSLDIEGMDLEILHAWDFRLSRPAVFCVETLTYDTENRGLKRPEMTPLLESAGYWLYADTYINSIYVDGRRWEAGRAAA